MRPLLVMGSRDLPWLAKIEHIYIYVCVCVHVCEYRRLYILYIPNFKSHQLLDVTLTIIYTKQLCFPTCTYNVTPAQNRHGRG